MTVADVLINIFENHPELVEETINDFGGIDNLIKMYKGSLEKEQKDLEVLKYEIQESEKSIKDAKKLIKCFKKYKNEIHN